MSAAQAIGPPARQPSFACLAHSVLGGGLPQYRVVQRDEDSWLCAGGCGHDEKNIGHTDVR